MCRTVVWAALSAWGPVVLRVQRRDGEQKRRGLGQAVSTAESKRSSVLTCSRVCRAME